MTKSAVESLTVKLPTVFVGFDVREEWRWIVKGAVVNFVVFVSIVVWDPSSSSIPVTDSDFMLNA